MSTYAIIETGGKQYRVSPGDVLEVERLDTPPGDTIQIEKVLLVNVDDRVTVGRPLVEGARVTAMVEDEGKGKKIIVFKYKPKVRYRRKIGHRQLYSRIAIQEIETDGGAAKPARKPTARRTRKPKEEVASDGPQEGVGDKQKRTRQPRAKAGS